MAGWTFTFIILAIAAFVVLVLYAANYSKLTKPPESAKSAREVELDTTLQNLASTNRTGTDEYRATLAERNGLAQARAVRNTSQQRPFRLHRLVIVGLLLVTFAMAALATMTATGRFNPEGLFARVDAVETRMTNAESDIALLKARPVGASALTIRDVETAIDTRLPPLVRAEVSRQLPAAPVPVAPIVSVPLAAPAPPAPVIEKRVVVRRVVKRVVRPIVRPTTVIDNRVINNYYGTAPAMPPRDRPIFVPPRPVDW